MFKHKYTEEELREVKCESFQRGVFMGYEYAQSGRVLLVFNTESSSGRTLDFESKNLGSNPNSVILKEWEEVASKYWEEK